MRGYATKGCAVALVIVLFVLAMGTLASACGRCNTPCSWTWNYSSCCTKTYVYPATSYYCGGCSSATRIAIGRIRAATQPTGRAAESAITTALPATVALAGTHAIRVAPSQIASRIQATHTMFLQSRASA